MIGNCQNVNNCKFTHSIQEKYKHCKHYIRSGNCPFREKCKFIHDDTMIVKVSKKCTKYHERKR